MDFLLDVMQNSYPNILSDPKRPQVFIGCDVGNDGYFAVGYKAFQDGIPLFFIIDFFKTEKQNRTADVKLKSKAKAKEKNVMSFEKNVERLMKVHSLAPIMCFEELFVMPFHSRSSCFTSGFNQSVAHSICEFLGGYKYIVRPEQWKEEFGLDKDKEKSLILFSQLVFNKQIIFHCKEPPTEKQIADHNFVEAVLLCYYASTKF